MTRRGLAAVLAATVALGACGGEAPTSDGSPTAAPVATSTAAAPATPTPTTVTSGTPSPSPSMPPSETADAVTSATTGAPASPACPARSGTATIDGHEVLVRVPASAGSVPLIVALHGYKGTPGALEQLSQLTELLGDRAVLAYPSGSPLDLGFGWNSGAGRFATTDTDDVALLAAVIDELSADGCVDPDRVVVVGESNGGGMAVRLSCDERMDGRVHTVVLVNPAIDDAVLSLCSGSNTPVRSIATVGLLDTVVPVDGSRDPFVSVDVWQRTLAPKLSGCSTEVSTTTYSSTVDLSSSMSCARCSALYVVADGPHTWPGRPTIDDGYIPGSFALTALLRDVILDRPDDCV